MSHVPSRRQFIHAAAAAAPAALALGRGEAAAAEPMAAMFPSQPAELVQEMVVVAHGNVARVRELVLRQNTLAKAAWDWGFGDWETALGAASHVGNREIADLLLAHGAHPTMFSAAMLGQLDVVKAFIAAAPGVERTRGPHSISLLKHAVAGGSPAQPVVEYPKTLEGADRSPRDETAERGRHRQAFGRLRVRDHAGGSLRRRRRERAAANRPARALPARPAPPRLVRVLADRRGERPARLQRIG